MKFPSASHPISIDPAVGRVTVWVGGSAVARSSKALVMSEGGHEPVYYIPRDDASMERLTRTTHTTYCAYKGHASYFSIRSADEVVENAVWSYEEPYPAVADIRAHLAFYMSKVDRIEFEPAADL